MIKQPGDISYPFLCESPTKPQTKGQVGELLMSPESHNLRPRNGYGVVYAITVTTPKKGNSRKRKVLELTRPLFQQIQSEDELKERIKQKQTKLPEKVTKGYAGLTKNSPRKRLRTHGKKAGKKSHLSVHKAMREGGQKGKVVRATVVATAPLEKLGAVEEAFRQMIADNKENICLNMRKGGAGGGGHKL